MNLLHISLSVALILVFACSCRPKAVPQPKPPSQLTYTPEGCNYTVSTPNVDEATVSENGPALAPPDHVRASFAGDPSTSFSVTWQTVPEQRASVLLFGTDRTRVLEATEEGSGVQMRRAHTFVYKGTTDLEKTRVHEAHVCGLKPDTVYFYKVGAVGGFSPVTTIRTAPATGATTTFRFGVAGDTRDSVSVF